MRAALALVVVAACGGAGDVTVVETCDDDVGPAPAGLAVPAVIDVPYVAAGAGASTVSVLIENLDAEEASGPDGADLDWRLSGDADFAIVDAPARVAACGAASLVLRWAGASAPRIAAAALAVDSNAGPRSAEVYGVAGDPRLGPAELVAVHGAGDVVIGRSAVVHMPTAPFPAPGRPWTDDRVHLFVPDGYRERDAQDVALHFHGHDTTIDATVPAHAYREHVWASGADVVLVVPQGPVDAASGDFGKLMDPAGTAAFLDEVLTVLYRAGVITRPVLGDVVLTSHSGGYQAVALNLAPSATFHVGEVHLFDSLYGYLPTYRDFVVDGGRLRSDYTSGGGTGDNNRTLAMALLGLGVDVATAPTTSALRDARAVVTFTAATHEGSTADGGAYGEWLRWGLRHHRRGARAELRSVVGETGGATVSWRAPDDDDRTGWRIETSTNRGARWDGAAELAADATSAHVALEASAWVRVVPSLRGVDDTVAQPTDAYRVDPVPAAGAILVVDGFDRVVDGSFGGLAHALAARVADATAASGFVHTIARRALAEDGFALAPYRAVIWLCGDDSTDTHTFTAAERVALDAYVAGGGRVILSGSEIGYELGPTADGAAWLARIAGAVYATDNSGANAASGIGPLADIGTFTFGGPAAPYLEEYPDTFTATGAGVVLMRYLDGGTAAIGVRGRAVLVGFPLETIEVPAQLAAVVHALVGYVAP